MISQQLDAKRTQVEDPAYREPGQGRARMRGDSRTTSTTAICYLLAESVMPTMTKCGEMDDDKKKVLTSNSGK
jgi:hypothetical protein